MVYLALEAQIELLPSVGPVERPEAIDRCLAAISTLSGVVKDASSYLPAYDQRSYSEVRDYFQPLPLALGPGVSWTNFGLGVLANPRPLRQTIGNSKSHYSKAEILVQE